MNQRYIQRLALYRFRYHIAYALVLLFLVGLSVWQIGSVPIGYTDRELVNIQASATLPFSADASLTNLPYHLLQKASLHFFGLTTVGAVLPSILIGIISGLALLALLIRLFPQNVALISTMLAVTAALFLTATRSAVPDIMMIFWPVVIMLIGALIVQKARFWQLLRYLLPIVVAVSLYTPLMIYLVIAAVIAAFIHPHLRYTLRHNISGIGYTIAIFFVVVLLFPMGWVSYFHPEEGIALLGLPSTFPSFSEYLAGAKEAVSHAVNFIQPSITTYITPAFSIVSLFLMLFGFIQACKDHHSSRTYVVLIWSAFIIPLICFHPEQLIIIFIPSILLMAIGVQSLIREWYRLFPRNPYARVSGLLPLSVLIVSMLTFNFTSYFYGYSFSPSSSQYFSSDLTVARKELARQGTAPIVLRVNNKDVPLYDLLRRDYPQVIVESTSVAFDPSKKTAAVANDTNIDIAPSTVWVNAYSKDALRFRVFEP